VTVGIGDPIDALARIYTDTVLHDPRVLRFVIEIIGADRVMMGSDSPFPIGDLAPTKIVASSGVDAAMAARINGGLAAELFRID
jgi:aminocarboxymuconate-semialdehyde decarboxylase